MEKDLSILLVEDDPQDCKDIIDCIDETADLVLVDVTNNATKAFELINHYLPDVVILDLELHQGSGNGLFLLNELQTSSLGKMPYILVTTNNSSALTYESARNLGADFILSKHQSDYSAQTVISFLRTIKNTIQNRHKNSHSLKFDMESPEMMHKRIRKRIATEMNRIGISPKSIGYTYLIDAIQIVMQASTSNLCCVIGSKYGKTESSVERAMQNAIARAWRNTPIDVLLSYYTARINSEKGVPTNTEFIYYYANKLKNE